MGQRGGELGGGDSASGSAPPVRQLRCPPLAPQHKRLRPAALRGALLLPVHRVCEHGGGDGGPAALLAEGGLLLRVRAAGRDAGGCGLEGPQLGDPKGGGGAGPDHGPDALVHCRRRPRRGSRAPCRWLAAVHGRCTRLVAPRVVERHREQLGAVRRGWCVRAGRGVGAPRGTKHHLPSAHRSRSRLGANPVCAASRPNHETELI